MTLHIGMLLFPKLTQLDLTGPFEVFHRIPDAKVHLVWKDTQPVYADSGLGLLPTTTLADCPALDIVFVPGGRGQTALMTDPEILEFLRRHGRTARYVTSVCTGSLVLGAAGLLDGYNATTHWGFTELLGKVGARHVPGRVVVDRNRITGGGVTAGIDFALQVAAEVAGPEVAKAIQLGIEYNPAPPFHSGHPDVADPALVAQLRARFGEIASRLG
ncbi:MAG TPA: DJ-1/PfpI family protein [Kofleriaceae bacterium]|jgi:cyclohexyl-isocyanide hydratase|nr:DJ-1/PfpI family protein [Kofleriaceae bacterium]